MKQQQFYRTFYRNHTALCGSVPFEDVCDYLYLFTCVYCQQISAQSQALCLAELDEKFVWVNKLATETIAKQTFIFSKHNTLQSYHILRL